MSIHHETQNEIKEILRAQFHPSELNVIDDSQAHRGHAEAMLHPQAGHFKICMPIPYYGQKPGGTPSHGL